MQSRIFFSSAAQKFHVEQQDYMKRLFKREEFSYAAVATHSSP